MNNRWVTNVLRNPECTSDTFVEDHEAVSVGGAVRSMDTALQFHINHQKQKEFLHLFLLDSCVVIPDYQAALRWKLSSAAASDKCCWKR